MNWIGSWFCPWSGPCFTNTKCQTFFLLSITFCFSNTDSPPPSCCVHCLPTWSSSSTTSKKQWLPIRGRQAAASKDGGAGMRRYQEQQEWGKAYLLFIFTFSFMSTKSGFIQDTSKTPVSQLVHCTLILWCS